MHGFENSKGRNFSKMGQVTSSRHPRQRDESTREQRKWGLRRRHLENCLLLTVSQPGKTPWKLTKHRRCVLEKAEGCWGWLQLQTAVSNQIINLLWATTWSSQMLLISQQKVQDVYPGVCKAKYVIKVIGICQQDALPRLTRGSH